MRLTERWSRFVDARALGIARMAVGAAAVVKLLVIAPVLFTLAHSATVRLPHVPGFAPVIVAPVVTVGIWAAAAVALALGIATRWAGAVLCGTAFLTLATDWQLYSNHLYLLALLAGLLAAADAGAALSFDAGRRGRRPVRLIGPDLIRLQVSIVYVYAALMKINPAFLSGWVLDTSMRGGFVEFPARLREPYIMAWAAGLAVLIELLLPFALWSRRFRVPAAVVGAALHLGFVLLLPQWRELIVFGLLMLGTYPLFLLRDREDGDRRQVHGLPDPLAQAVDRPPQPAPIRSSSRTKRG